MFPGETEGGYHDGVFEDEYFARKAEEEALELAVAREEALYYARLDALYDKACYELYGFPLVVLSEVAPDRQVYDHALEKIRERAKELDHED